MAATASTASGPVARRFPPSPPPQGPSPLVEAEHGLSVAAWRTARLRGPLTAKRLLLCGCCWCCQPARCRLPSFLLFRSVSGSQGLARLTVHLWAAIDTLDRCCVVCCVCACVCESVHTFLHINWGTPALCCCSCRCCNCCSPLGVMRWESCRSQSGGRCLSLSLASAAAWEYGPCPVLPCPASSYCAHAMQCRFHASLQGRQDPTTDPTDTVRLCLLRVCSTDHRLRLAYWGVGTSRSGRLADRLSRPTDAGVSQQPSNEHPGALKQHTPVRFSSPHTSPRARGLEGRAMAACRAAIRAEDLRGLSRTAVLCQETRLVWVVFFRHLQSSSSVQAPSKEEKTGKNKPLLRKKTQCKQPTISNFLQTPLLASSPAGSSQNQHLHL